MSSPQLEREIGKARLIAALLAELDAAGAVILVAAGTECPPRQGTLRCEFRTPFQDSTVIIDSVDAALTRADCTCCYGGQRFRFELERVDATRWRLPTRVRISDFRRDPRMAFASRGYSAELIAARGATYGYAVDVNRDYLAVDIDGKHKLVEGDAVQAIIRMINTNVDVFFNDCVVAQVKPTADGARLLLRRQLGRPDSAQYRRFARNVVDAASIKLSGSPFADDIGDANLIIHNISYGGMTVALRDDADAGRLVPGLVLRSLEPELSFLLVWVQAGAMGLRPLLGDPEHLAAWHRYVDEIAPPADRRTRITRKELADLLTLSGLLKGSRREHLGHSVRDHMIASAAGESPLLIQRCIIADQHGAPDLHISSRRISELAWFFGEGAALTEKVGDFNAMVDAAVIQLGQMARQSHLFCRYLTVIWHHTVKSSVAWGQAMLQHKETELFDAFQLSIQRLRQLRSNPTPGTLPLPLVGLAATQRRELAGAFSAMLYESVAGGDGSHPLLNAELSKSGPYHRAITEALVDGAGAGLIAHRIFTHNIWSSTGVTNSIFVLVPNGMSVADLAAGLLRLSDAAIAHGTDDFLLIAPHAQYDEAGLAGALPTPKHFAFLVHDLLRNPTLAYRDDPAAARRRGDGGAA